MTSKTGECKAVHHITNSCSIMKSVMLIGNGQRRPEIGGKVKRINSNVFIFEYFYFEVSEEDIREKIAG